MGADHRGGALTRDSFVVELMSELFKGNHYTRRSNINGGKPVEGVVYPK